MFSQFDLITIKCISPERILEWAHQPNCRGEILNAETLHYKTLQPRLGGLFCQQIFGAVSARTCYCKNGPWALRSKKKKTIEKEREKDNSQKKQLKKKEKFFSLKYENELEANRTHSLSPNPNFLINSSRNQRTIIPCSDWSKRQLIRSHFFHFGMPTLKFSTRMWTFFKASHMLEFPSKQLSTIRILSERSTTHTSLQKIYPLVNPVLFTQSERHLVKRMENRTLLELLIFSPFKCHLIFV